MQRIVIRLDHRVKCRVRGLRRTTRDKGLADRCQMVLLASKGRGREAIAEAVGRSVSWVNRVLARFRDDGVAGLIDRREDNGTVKLDEYFLSRLKRLVDGTPQDPPPPWTKYPSPTGEQTSNAASPSSTFEQAASSRRSIFRPRSRKCSTYKSSPTAASPKCSVFRKKLQHTFLVPPVEQPF